MATPCWRWSEQASSRAEIRNRRFIRPQYGTRGFDAIITSLIFATIVAVAAIVAGAIAAVAGFGIGSILTPLLALHFGTKVAVAVAAVPHLIGTIWRFVSLRCHVDRTVLIRFGILSAAGGLIGALLNAKATSGWLTIVFAALLLFAGITGITGIAERMRFGRKTAWSAGALSGLFGGLVGNQGGIRSAALLGFDIPKESVSSPQPRRSRSRSMPRVCRFTSGPSIRRCSRRGR
jgi:uncharacterized membrane protein YfcA